MLVIFRFIASIPVPGVDREGLQDFIENNQLLGDAQPLLRQRPQNFSIVALGRLPVHHRVDHHAADDADHSAPE